MEVPTLPRGSSAACLVSTEPRMLQLPPKSAVTQVIPPFRSSSICGGDIDLGMTIVVLASARIRERIV